MKETCFLAGAAKGEITPAKELMPMPLIWLIRFKEVLDPIYVRVVAMSDKNRQCLFVAFEMTLVPYARETLEFLKEETGIPEEYIFLCATHTHGTTPVSLGMYKENSKAEKKCRRWYEDIKKTLLETVKRAQKAMVPAKIGYGTGISRINANRDGMFQGTSRLGINYERPSDHTIRLVRLETVEEKPIALIVNYACHAVVMNGCLKGLTTPLTGDFPGRTCAKLEETTDIPVVLWCSGAAGDQNPWIMSQCGMAIKKTYKNRNIGKAAERILEHFSREHAADILEANSGIVCDRKNVSIRCFQKMSLVEAKEESDEKVPYLLRLFLLGDIAFEGISAEIVTSVGKSVRKVSPYEKTMLISHANGYQGYVADEWEYEHHAFEVGNSKVKKGAAEKAFVNDFTELFSISEGNADNQ